MAIAARRLVSVRSLAPSRRFVFLLPFVVYLAPFLVLPFDRDETAYAIVARGLLHGQLPYRDLFDHKPPPIYGYYALSFILFGEHQWAPRVLGAGFLSATAGCLFLVAQRIFSRRRAYVLAGLFALATGALLGNFNANTEVFAIFPALASFALLHERQRRSNWQACLGAGLLGAIATWTRPLVLPACLILGLWLLLERQWRSAAVYAGGVLAVSAIVPLPWIWAGAFGDFRYAVFTYNNLYAHEFDGQQWVPWLLGLPGALIGLAPLVATAYLGLRWRIRQRHFDRSFMVLLTWSAGMAVGQTITGHYAEHYVLLMVPSLVVFAGYLAGSPHWQMRSPLPWLVIGLTVICAIVNCALFPRMLGADDPEQRAGMLARELEATTLPTDAIWEFGRVDGPYFDAHRASPTRFFYDRPFWLDPSTFNEAMGDLTAHPPAVVIDSWRFPKPILSEQITTRLGAAYYPAALAAFLSEHYALPYESHGALLYRLR